MISYRSGNCFSQQGKPQQQGFVARFCRFFARKKKIGARGVNVSVCGVQKCKVPFKHYTGPLFSGLLLGVCACAVVWFIYSMLVQSDVFRLNEIRVSGNSLVTRKQIVHAGGVERGVCLLGMDTEELAANVAALPWIERAAVEKQWPSSLAIKVREERPLALVNVEVEHGRNQLFYLNKKGKLFTGYNQGQDLDFPVVTGVRWPVDKEKNRLPSGEFEMSALKLLQLAAKGSPILPIQSISEVHLDPDHGIVVYLVDKPFPIYFGTIGTKQIHTQYYRLVKIFERLYRKKKIDGINAIRVNYAENKILVARTESEK